MSNLSISVGNASVISLEVKGADVTHRVQHGNAILDIAASFIRELGYTPPSLGYDADLKTSVVRELQSWNIGETVNALMKGLDVGLAAAELLYPLHAFEVKEIMAIYTVAIVWIDQVADSIVEALTEFQYRFHNRRPQIESVLDEFARLIHRFYDHFEPHAANAMVMSSCAFMDGNRLEVQTLTKHMPVKMGAKLWPYYVRNLTGVAEVFAFACFPKKDHANLADYLQAIPEISIFSNFLNDALSFYKEEMDGEEHNYCQMMSRASGRPPIDILEDVVREAVSTANRAEQILGDSPVALESFKLYKQGFIRFHLDLARYRFPPPWKAQFHI